MRIAFLAIPTARNSKAVRVASLCLRIKYYVQNGLAMSELHEILQFGLKFSSSGQHWRRQQQVIVSQILQLTAHHVTRFGGSENFSMSIGAICTFTVTESGKSIRVAKGCVYPRLTYLKGGKVVASSVVSCFSELLYDL